jgi:hypothetical protein
MSKKKRKIAFLGGAAVGAALLVAAPIAGADPGTGPHSPSWGQEVKACNQSSCYPGGTNRGTYVRDQAQDDQTPGYGREIHDLATPGNSNPPNLGGPETP